MCVKRVSFCPLHTVKPVSLLTARGPCCAWRVRSVQCRRGLALVRRVQSVRPQDERLNRVTTPALFARYRQSTLAHQPLFFLSLVNARHYTRRAFSKTMSYVKRFGGLGGSVKMTATSELRE